MLATLAFSVVPAGAGQPTGLGGDTFAKDAAAGTWLPLQGTSALLKWPKVEVKAGETKTVTVDRRGQIGVNDAIKTGAAFMLNLRAGKKITLVAMGTSLTGGTWRWPDVMMNDWLNKEFPGQITFFNEGVGASASSVGPGNNPGLSGLGRLPAVIAHQPDVVFIEFATNDSYLPYKISLEDSKKNLNTMIDRILAANPKTEIILQTMNSVQDNPQAGPGNLHASTRPELGAYAQGTRDVAKARGLLLVDHYPNWEKLMKEAPARFDQLVPDRIHPQSPGNREILLPELKITLTSCGPRAVK